MDVKKLLDKIFLNIMLHCLSVLNGVANDQNIIKILLLLLQPFNGLFSRTTWVSRYQKGKTNLDFSEARDSEWQWHQLGHMQVYTSLQTDNHASTPPLSFLQAGCPSCHPTNSVKALKALCTETTTKKCKTEKVKTVMLRSNSKSLGESCSQS